MITYVFVVHYRYHKEFNYIPFQTNIIVIVTVILVIKVIAIIIVMIIIITVGIIIIARVLSGIYY